MNFLEYVNLKYGIYFEVSIYKAGSNAIWNHDLMLTVPML